MKWINEEMNEWMTAWNEWLSESTKFANLIFQMCSDTLSFLRFLCGTELSLQACAHFAGLIFQTSFGRPSCFFNEFYVKSSSRYSLVHILSTSWSKSGPTLTVF